MTAIPALTSAQQDLKTRIDAAQGEVTRANRLYAAAIEARTGLQNLCTAHVAVARNPERPDEGGATCAICMRHLGWFCAESPDHVCHYNDADPADEGCIHCGEPEERK